MQTREHEEREPDNHEHDADDEALRPGSLSDDEECARGQKHDDGTEACLGTRTSGQPSTDSYGWSGWP
jgi:hypothetical protein